MIKIKISHHHLATPCHIPSPESLTTGLASATGWCKSTNTFAASSLPIT
jgi:hypothetical protein